MAKIKSKLPSGFKTISGFGDSWKPAKVGEILQGRMASVRMIKVERKEGKKMVKKPVNIYTIVTAQGDVDVFESAGLRPLARVKKGQQVYIEMTGKRRIKLGQNPMREFTIAVK